MINRAVIGEYKVIKVFASYQKFKNMWQFEILTWVSIGTF